MYKNYLKIAWRNLKRNKGYSAINIGGLALGMAVAMIIGLYILDELNFNKEIDKYDRIAKVMQHETYNGQIVSSDDMPLPLADELRTTYKDYFKHIALASWNNYRLLEFEDKKIMQPGSFIESGITEILNLEMVEGTRTGLADPNSILISQSLANSLFGDSNAIGQIVKLDNESPLKVIGVYEDLPQNSEFGELKFIGSWHHFKQTLPDWLTWGNNWFTMYAEVTPNAELTQVSEAIKNSKIDHVSPEERKFESKIFLHPMSKWYLYSEFENGINTGGRIYYVWLFGIVGLFGLLLACINFMNLMTAQSEKRTKEIGLRKTIGSFKKQLVSQFLTESLLVSSFAFVVALGLSFLFLPLFNEVAEKTLQIPIGKSGFWGVGFLLVLVTGLLAGSYPAFYLSSFNPLKALRGSFKSGKSATTPRKVLVVFQYAISVILIIATIIIYQQIDYAKDRPMGYDQDNLVSFNLNTDKIVKHFDAIREELIQSGTVVEVAATDNDITSVFNTNGGLEWQGKDPNMTDQFVTLTVTPEFGKTVNWEVTEGRDFSREMSTDSTGFILNEAAVGYMGFENPIGQKIRWGPKEYPVIGVVKNLVNQSPYDQAKPSFYLQDPSRLRIVNIKISPDVAAFRALDKIKEVYAKFEPVIPIDYKFLDLEYSKKFDYETRIGKLVSFFALLAIFISCLGLFGVASFVAAQRTKEIGIRKVLGASMLSLWKMLSKDFVILVLISCAIAIPVANHFLSQWLQKYEYSVEISWWVFGAAIAGTLFITLLTVSFQAIKAASANPVKSLRAE